MFQLSSHRTDDGSEENTFGQVLFASPPCSYLSAQPLHQRCKLVLVAWKQWLARCSLRNADKLTLANFISGGDRELDGVGEIARVAIGVADLQSRVGSDEPIIDMVDKERFVSLMRIVVTRSGKNVASVSGFGDVLGALVVGEEDDVNLWSMRRSTWTGGMRCGSGEQRGRKSGDDS